MVDNDERAARRATNGGTSRRMLPTGFATLRDVVTFVIGLGIIINEVFLQPTVEPAAVAIGVAMTGLPLVFGADERRKAPPPGEG